MKVTFTEKSEKKNEIDYTKGFFINKAKTLIVLANDDIPIAKPCFSGSIVATKDEKWRVSYKYKSLNKSEFTPFEGTITVEL